MPTIAIIGAGPGLGLAIARTFGSQGFDVALISRNKGRLDALAAELAADGITAAGFPADVLDRPSLRAALAAAKERFGGIDVLEYSPGGDAGPGGHPSGHPAERTAADRVLPVRGDDRDGRGAARPAGGRGRHVAVHDRRRIGLPGRAVRQRHRRWGCTAELGAQPRRGTGRTGVHIAHIAIGLAIADEAPAPGYDFLPAGEIAPLYWDLHHTRAVHELVVKK